MLGMTAYDCDPNTQQCSGGFGGDPTNGFAYAVSGVPLFTGYQGKGADGNPRDPYETPPIYQVPLTPVLSADEAPAPQLSPVVATRNADGSLTVSHANVAQPQNQTSSSLASWAPWALLFVIGIAVAKGL